MKRRDRLLPAAILAAGCFVPFAVSGVLFDLDLCGNTKLAEALSPRGDRRAVVFTRDCGATTGYSTQVSVLAAEDELPNDAGNVFVADAGSAPTGAGGGPAVEAVWLGESRLVIRHHPGARVFHSETRVGGVDVTYERGAPE